MKTALCLVQDVQLVQLARVLHELHELHRGYQPKTKRSPGAGFACQQNSAFSF